MALENLPRFDGTLLCDNDSRSRFSSDVARNIQRVPLAVLQPGSVEDVVRIVRYANERRLTVAMRGQGHSRYGQTLAGGGIVIDSSTLNQVILSGPEAVDAQAGATWGQVTEVTLAKDLTVPAMGTCPGLSIGGMLSVGGYSNSSHRHGAIADAAEELDVVTGDGRLVTCSPREEWELFEMVLAGMGQCALIVQARLRLAAAPARVVRQDLVYHDLRTFLADTARLAADDGFDHLNSRAVRARSDEWRFVINVGRFYSGAEPKLESFQAGLKYVAKEAPVSSSYWDYLQREEPKNAAGLEYRAQNPVREPSLVMFLPDSAVEAFADSVLGSVNDLMGLADFQFNAFNVRRFRSPLFRFPEGEIAFGLWLYPRYIAMSDDKTYAKAMDSNQRMLERMNGIGGKAYPPYAPYSSPREWELHYGPALWPRLSAAKREYDPNRVLTPGPGMFSN